MVLKKLRQKGHWVCIYKVCYINLFIYHSACYINIYLSFCIFCVQFSSVAQLRPTLCDPMACRRPGFPVYRQLLEHTQTHVHLVGDVIQPSHSLLSPSPTVFNLSQHQCLFQWVSFALQVAKVLEFHLQHQSF